MGYYETINILKKQNQTYSNLSNQLDQNEEDEEN